MKKSTPILLQFFKNRQFHIIISEALPTNALAGAFDNKIIFSKNLIQKVTKGRISVRSFFFIFFHELVHVAQQTILSKNLLKDKIVKYINSNRESLEIEANEIALYFMERGIWKKFIPLINFSKAQESIQSLDYDNEPVQWWMVDGILSELLLTENPEKKGKADDIKKQIRAALDNAKNDPGFNKILGSKESSEYSNQIFNVQAAAIEEGIHETYARDALTEFEENCNKHIDPKSKLHELQLRLKRDDNGWKNYLTEKAGKIIHKINRESVVQGAQWNDRWHYSNLKFGIKFCISENFEGFRNAFIYSSHLKRMQFLHSMDCSGGSKVFNHLKIRRWVEFCIDVFNDIEVIPPGKHIQEMTLNEYVDIIDDNLFRIMMRDLHDSKYGRMTIKNFFSGGKYDAGSIALGTVTHMIQDSFALSHAKRSLDPFSLRLIPNDMSFNTRKNKTDVSSIENDLNTQTSEDGLGNPIQVENFSLKNCKENIKKDKKNWNYDEFQSSLARQATPIILYANYEKQSSSKHKHADIFLTHIDFQKSKSIPGRLDQWFADNRKMDDILHDDFYKQTLNATMARDCSEMFIYMAAMDYSKEDILEFIDSIYPSFDIVGKTTESGMQFGLENVVDQYYETIVESLMCYNFNEALINRIITFNRVITLLEGIIKRTDKNNKEREKECFFHICEIINEIISWTYSFLKNLDNNKSSTTNSHCSECARSINPLIERINRILDILKKRNACLDEETIVCINFFNECKNILKKLSNHNILSDNERKKIKNHFKDWASIFRDLKLKPEDFRLKYSKERCFVIHIFTGDVIYAGTDANIHLKVYGKKNGSTTEILIEDQHLIDNNGNSFERCSEEIFEIYTNLDINEITRIEIGHDGKWGGDGWYIKDIFISAPLDLYKILTNSKSILSNSNENGWMFPVNAWIGKNEEMNLYSKSIEKGKYFSIKVYTGNEAFAGTNSDIYISLNGNDEIKLDNGLNNFEKKDIDIFAITFNSNIGEVSKIKIENKGSDIWFVDKIVITDIVTEITKTFIIKQRIIKGAPLFSSQEKNSNFVIDIYTGNQSLGGTNDNVAIELIGTEGRTGKRIINNSKDNFEQGDKDTFSISSEKSIGQIIGVNIWKDGIDDWFLDKISIKDVISGESKTFYANCEVNGLLNLPKINEHYFKIDVYTGNKSKAGTNSNVYISFLDQNKDKIQGKEFKLDNSEDNFESEYIDSFYVTTNFIFDEVSYIAIRKTGFDDWFLEKIIITDCTTEHVKEYMANTWVKSDVVILPNENTDFFIVDVYTSNQAKGGTNDHVFITIFGENGNTEKIELDNKKDNFEQGDKDSFIISSKKIIGSINSIEIEKNGSDDWFVDKIIVTNKFTNKEYFFVINKLIKKEKIIFFPQVSRQAFIVDIYTGEEYDQEEAQSYADSHVTLSIIGEDGQIDAKPNNSKINFEVGDKDSFTVVGSSRIGDISRIEVKLDGCKNWFLHKLVITDIVTSEEWTFYANRWIRDQEIVSLEKERICLKLDIYTKDESDASAGGDISIQLYGKNTNEASQNIGIIASYTKIPLLLKYIQDPQDHNNKIPVYRFQEGCHNSYTIYSPSKIYDEEINSIEKICIKQNGEKAWGLDKIIITNIATEKIWGIFVANEAIEGKNKEYELIAKQENIFMADFWTTNKIKTNYYESWIKMSLFNSLHKELTPFIALNSSEEDFDKGSIYSFIIAAENSIDAIKFIKIRQEGLCKSFFQKITITDINKKSVEKTFVPLSEISPNKIYELEEIGNDNYISLDIYTSELNGACTHDDIGVTVIGSICIKNPSIENSSIIKKNVTLCSCNNLDNAKNNFEEGQNDVFTLKIDRTGLELKHDDILEIDEITELKISKRALNSKENSDRGISDDWNVDRIVVTDIRTGKEWIFIAKTWMKNETITLSCEKRRHFIVDIYTNGSLWAGTDGTVKISINEKEKELDNRYNNFEAGHKDSFTIHFDKPFMSECTEIDDEWEPNVKIFYSGIDNWKPDLFVIKDLNSDNTWVYVPEKNLVSKEWNTLKKCNPNCCFVVNIYTSGEGGSGTNANVKIAINNIISKNSFNDKHDNYESGCTDSFIINYEESIGEPSFITISHDGTGINSNWKLGKIIIKDIVSQKNWLFSAGNNCWIKANEEITLHRSSNG